MMRVGCSKGESSRKNCKDGPSQETTRLSFGFAASCEAWLSLAVSVVLDLGCALLRLARDNGRAIPKQGRSPKETNRANGKAQPCLTTSGRAEHVASRALVVSL